MVSSMLQSNAVSGSNAAATSVVGEGVKRIGDNRRSNKPIMEKRRRARINNCLNELKTLILDAMKKDPARHSKLEKADILEMTVKHLQNLQRSTPSVATATETTLINKFKAGFTECAAEVGRFPGIEPLVKRKLLQHLSNCLNHVTKLPEVPQVQVHILPNNNNNNPQVAPQSGIILSNGAGSGVQLLPTRLPNGDIALVLPGNAQQCNAQMPVLVPIVHPERAASRVSDTSDSYCSSESPEPMDVGYNNSQQKPLSLVVRKNVEMLENNDEEKPWRPW